MYGPRQIGQKTGTGGRAALAVTVASYRASIAVARRSASPAAPVTSPSSRIIRIPSRTALGKVTPTDTPASRSRSTTSRRFSSMLSTTRSAAKARVRSTSGSFWRPTLGWAPTRARGPAQKSVMPAIRSSRPRAKSVSVMLGTSETIRSGRAASATSAPLASRRVTAMGSRRLEDEARPDALDARNLERELDRPSALAKRGHRPLEGHLAGVDLRLDDRALQHRIGSQPSLDERGELEVGLAGIGGRDGHRWGLGGRRGDRRGRRRGGRQNRLRRRRGRL